MYRGRALQAAHLGMAHRTRMVMGCGSSSGVGCESTGLCELGEARQSAQIRL